MYIGSLALPRPTIRKGGDDEVEGSVGLAASLVLCLPLLLPAPLLAQGSPPSTDGRSAEAPESRTTRVMIRATSHDAKIIGSGVGGARITVTDTRTGRVLARGVQEGGTGDTEKLVIRPRERAAEVHDTEGAAGYMAELELTEPTRVRIEAEGPLGTPHATQRASRTMLLVPGRHVLGDGVILQLYGFTVELLEPSSDVGLLSGTEVPVRARVTMLCGCPTEPGGLWDADEYEIEVRIVGQDGRVLESEPLEFAGETSVYEGRITVPDGHRGLKLQVLAMDPAKANFGMVERRLGTP